MSEPDFYVVLLRGGIEPSIAAGPFETPDAQIEAAKKLFTTIDQEDDQLVWLDIMNGEPHMGSFDPQTFEEVNR